MFEKLNENLYDWENIENEICMVELAIYQKKIEELKNQKLYEIREMFEQQARFYHQKGEKYQHKVGKNIQKYKNEIEKLIHIYDQLYINVFKIMQSAINNQKIAMANIVTLTERLQKKDSKDEEIGKIKSIIMACAEKKLNYDIMIDECKARIKWCIQNVQNDINEIFINHVYQLQINKENIVHKLRRIIVNQISGKRKYKRFLENYETQQMKENNIRNDVRILDVISTLKAMMKQMEKVKEQISMKYKERINL